MSDHEHTTVRPALESINDELFQELSMTEQERLIGQQTKTATACVTFGNGYQVDADVNVSIDWS